MTEKPQNEPIPEEKKPSIPDIPYIKDAEKVPDSDEDVAEQPTGVEPTEGMPEKTVFPKPNEQPRDIPDEEPTAVVEPDIHEEQPQAEPSEPIAVPEYEEAANEANPITGVKMYGFLALIAAFVVVDAIVRKRK